MMLKLMKLENIFRNCSDNRNKHLTKGNKHILLKNNLFGGMAYRLKRIKKNKKFGEKINIIT
jgi:hypothetical protein